jgi:aconitase B
VNKIVRHTGPVTREDLKDVRCTCGSTCDVSLDQTCHPGAGVQLYYSADVGVLKAMCVVCEKLVGAIQVAGLAQ